MIKISGHLNISYYGVNQLHRPDSTGDGSSSIVLYGPAHSEVLEKCDYLWEIETLFENMLTCSTISRTDENYGGKNLVTPDK